MSIVSNCTPSALKDAASALKSGQLVAFPTETVYGLGGDAQNKVAVAKIYWVKGRPKDHPLIVHISSNQNLDKWAKQIPEYAIKLASSFWPGPMTLILPRSEIAKDFITGGQDNVAIRVPSHPIAQALLKEFENLGGMGVAAPSANRFGKVSPTTAEAVEIGLSGYLQSSDQILDGGPSQVGVESTIIDCTQDLPTILRPGWVTAQMIGELLSVNLGEINQLISKVKAPGLLESHYAPAAKIYLTGHPQVGDGFIALSNVSTPDGVVRLASPEDNEEYARALYIALRLADNKGLKRIFVMPPPNEGVGIAINDRLTKAASGKIYE